MLRKLLLKVRAFEQEAHGILGRHEGSRSRVIVLDRQYRQLDKLSLRQDELLRQALRCAEAELYRAAHVMAWAGFMDFLEEKMASGGLKKLAGIRPKWPCGSVEDLREQVNEFQLIEACRELGLVSKSEVKALHGLLNKRNECAHPSNFYPDLNQALGYVSEVLSRITSIRARSL
jgi:hypothetical protein